MIPVAMQMIRHVESPNILEIGIDKGHSCFTIVHNLYHMFDKFSYTGIDIIVDPKIPDALNKMYGINVFSQENYKDFNVKIIEKNSLSFLQENISIDRQDYDIVFVDGDHNYFTVSHELSMIDKISNNNTLIVCDDYFGKWSERDGFYSERDDYLHTRQNLENSTEFNENGSVKIDPAKATAPISLERKGVKNAIDDFLRENDHWSILAFKNKETEINYESVILYKSEFHDISGGLEDSE
jgi:hypothetical protein